MEEVTITKFDRVRGGLKDVALFTQPSTVQFLQAITGKSETFIVETCRYPEHGGDYIFLQVIDENGTVRVALPPKVANTIASQRDSLTTRRRRIAGIERGKQLTEEEKQVLRDRLAKARPKALQARRKKKKTR